MTQMIRYRDFAYNDHEDIQSICRTVSDCMKTIKVCNRLIKDHTGLRTGRRPNKHATKWEMRQALNLPVKYPVDPRYSGEVDAMGNVTVIDKLSNNKIVGSITVQELDMRQLDPAYNPAASRPGVYFSNLNQPTGYATPGGVQKIVTSINNPGQAAVYAQQSESKILKALATILAATTLIGGIVAAIDAATSKSKATADLFSRFGSKVKSAVTSLFRSKDNFEKESSKPEDKAQGYSDVINSVNDLKNVMRELLEQMKRGKDSDYDTLKEQTKEAFEKLKKAQEANSKYKRMFTISRKKFYERLRNMRKK